MEGWKQGWWVCKCERGCEHGGGFVCKWGFMSGGWVCKGGWVSK